MYSLPMVGESWLYTGFLAPEVGPGQEGAFLPACVVPCWCLSQEEKGSAVWTPHACGAQGIQMGRTEAQPTVAQEKTCLLSADLES